MLECSPLVVGCAGKLVTSVVFGEVVGYLLAEAYTFEA